MIHKEDNSILEREEQLEKRKEFRPDFAVSNIFHNRDDDITLSEELCCDMQCLMLLENEVLHFIF